MEYYRMSCVHFLQFQHIDFLILNIFIRLSDIEISSIHLPGDHWEERFSSERAPAGEGGALKNKNIEGARKFVLISNIDLIDKGER